MMSQHKNDQVLTIDREISFGAAVKERSEIPAAYTWDLTSIYPSQAAWETELKRIREAIPHYNGFKGRISELSAKELHEFLHWSDELSAATVRVYVYASLQSAGDTRVALHQEQVASAGDLHTALSAATSFITPELLAIGADGLHQRISECPQLQVYRRHFDLILRAQPHTRSPEVEEVLAQSLSVAGTGGSAYGKLTSSDLVFRPVKTSSEELAVTQGSIEALVANTDRNVRRAAWESYYDGYLSTQNTLVALYKGTIDREVFYARVQRFPSAVEAALFTNEIPTAVYRQILDTCRSHQSVWQRYFRARAAALGIADLREYDVQAPLSPKPPVVPYRDGIKLIIEGLSPLGDEYLATLREGLHEQRWVDVFPNQGKEGNAYSSGTHGTHPFTLWNYTNTMTDVSTGAHELGHSMHSLYTNRRQPSCYSHYGMAVAETASNLNQAIMRERLLNQGDDNFKLAVLDETFHNLHRYLFVMPILARFELQCFQWVEAGEGLSADRLKGFMAELLHEAYGGTVTLDSERSGLFWAPFSHLHAPFYVFNYAAGIASANAIAARILEGDTDVRDRYLEALTFGRSVDQISTLRHAGVDLATPEPLERAFQIVERHISRLEEITARRQRA